MVNRAKKYNLTFRPHFKTHQCQEIGNWFRDTGVDKITVSSVKMAEYFARDGWTDITIAFPVNIHEIDTLKRLSSKIKIQILFSCHDTAKSLCNYFDFPVNVLLKIDVGTHRTGFDPKDSVKIDQQIDLISKNTFLNFCGFLSHAGHTYSAKSIKEVQKIHDNERKILKELKDRYRGTFPQILISVGDTPSCSIAENWEGIDEIRPGNFVFYDLTQDSIGSCTMDNIAVVLACPVVALHPERSEIVIYGGAIHLSKDQLKENNIVAYGKPVRFTKTGWDRPDQESFVKSLSQEHGVISASPETSTIPSS